MGLRFRQRLKIIPGVHLNISSKGMSLSLGGPGATVNLSRKHGTRLTVGIPGTGLSYQTSLSQPRVESGHSSSRREATLPPPLASVRDDVLPGFTPVASASLGVLIDNGSAELRDMIRDSYRYRQDLDREVTTLESNVRDAQHRLRWLDTWLGRWLFKERYQSRKDELCAAQEEVADARKILADYGLKIEWNLEPEIAEHYQNVVRMFRNLQSASAIWHTVSVRPLGHEERIVQRTISGATIQRKGVRFDLSRPTYLPPSANEPWPQVPALRKSNGATIYIFPSFFVFEDGSNFAVIEPHQIGVDSFPMPFIENERVPYDAKTIGNTWKFANKDGSPDRRYSDNTAIPIAEYGCLRLASPGLVNEEFLTSKADACVAFGGALQAYCRWFTENQEVMNRSGHEEPFEQNTPRRSQIEPKQQPLTHGGWTLGEHDNHAAGFSRIINGRFDIMISLQIDTSLWISVGPVVSGETFAWPADNNPLTLVLDGKALVSCRSLMDEYRQKGKQSPFEPVQGGHEGVAFQVMPAGFNNEERLQALVTSGTQHLIVLLATHEVCQVNLEIDDVSSFLTSLSKQLARNAEVAAAAEEKTDSEKSHQSA